MPFLFTSQSVASSRSNYRRFDPPLEKCGSIRGIMAERASDDGGVVHFEIRTFYARFSLNELQNCRVRSAAKKEKEKKGKKEER